MRVLHRKLTLFAGAGLAPFAVLIETVTLAVVGGLLGVLLGLVGVKLIERATDWQPVVTAWAIALAMGISSLTGIVFGIYPARRAALMNPVQALRHE